MRDFSVRLCNCQIWLIRPNYSSCFSIVCHDLGSKGRARAYGSQKATEIIWSALYLLCKLCVPRLIRSNKTAMRMRLTHRGLPWWRRGRRARRREASASARTARRRSQRRRRRMPGGSRPPGAEGGRCRTARKSERNHYMSKEACSTQKCKLLVSGVSGLRNCMICTTGYTQFLIPKIQH